MELLSISEIFYSLQGEGREAGVPTLFVRLQGCPFRCAWCDSEYTWAKKATETIEVSGLELDTTVVGLMEDYKINHLCVTGGEPLVQARELVPLLKGWVAKGWHIRLETSGLVTLPYAYSSLEGSYRKSLISPLSASNFSIIWDVKCPGSGEEKKNRWECLELLTAKDEVKFVVKDVIDLEFAKDVCNRYSLGTRPDSPTVLVSPVFSARGVVPEWTLAGFAQGVLAQMPYARLSLQIHKFIWGDKRGV